MRAVFLSLFIVVTLNITFAQYFNEVVYDEAIDREVIRGYCDREAVAAFEEFAPYYEENYWTYAPDEKIIGKLADLDFENVDILVVLATWCHDTKEQLPRFFRVCDEIELDGKMFTLIGVDRAKLAGNVNIEELKVERVPTFIFYRDREEVGRIIETPETSMEEDMFNILSE